MAVPVMWLWTAREICWRCASRARAVQTPVEAGAIMGAAVERHPSLESFTADQGCKVQARDAARKLDRELVVAKKRGAGIPSDRLSLGGGAHFRLAHAVPPACFQVKNELPHSF